MVRPESPWSSVARMSPGLEETRSLTRGRSRGRELCLESTRCNRLPGWVEEPVRNFLMAGRGSGPCRREGGREGRDGQSRGGESSQCSRSLEAATFVQQSSENMEYQYMKEEGLRQDKSF